MILNNRYSQNARRAVKIASQLAYYYAHAEVDTDHLLVGLLHLEGSLGNQILDELQVDTQKAEQILGRLHAIVEIPDGLTYNHLPRTLSLNRVLERALIESQTLGHHYVGTEHILLALVRQNDQQIGALLQQLNISSEQIRGRTLRLLRSGISEITIEAARRMTRLSELGRRVLTAAQQLAQAHEQKSVMLHHLLLVLARERRSVAYRLLPEANFEPTRLEILIPSLPEESVEGEASLDYVLDRAVDRAEAFGSHYTGTEHLLLAMTITLEGQALLMDCNVDLDYLQMRLHQILNGE